MNFSKGSTINESKSGPAKRKVQPSDPRIPAKHDQFPQFEQVPDSRFFPSTNQNDLKDIPEDRNPYDHEIPDHTNKLILDALNLQDNDEEGTGKKELIDDFEKLSRIFSNDRLDSKAGKFSARGSKNLYYPLIQADSNRSWNADGNSNIQNTSLTTAPSVGHLEKNDSSKFLMNNSQFLLDNTHDPTKMSPTSFPPHFYPNPQIYYPFVPMPLPEQSHQQQYYGNTVFGHPPFNYQATASFFNESQRRFSLVENPSILGRKDLRPKPQEKNNIYGKALRERMKAKISGKAYDREETFEVDVEGSEYCDKTTLMIKNIPNKYNLPLILETIDKNHKGTYDFFYLPIDFRNNCNVGYAFINFVDTRFIAPFYEEFAGKKWEKFNSEKICEIKYARIQGREALIQHFQYSSVMNQSDKKLKPVILPKSDLATIESLVQQQKAKAKEEIRQSQK